MFSSKRMVIPFSRFVFLFSILTQDAQKLIQASDDGSSSAPSSLRTEKSLNRQREWEIDHARVRARKLREERLKGFQQEEKVRELDDFLLTQSCSRPEMLVVCNTLRTSFNAGVELGETLLHCQQRMSQTQPGRPS